jgi:ubiquinone/menaquinone biosynthesis C-methylase UbiE
MGRVCKKEGRILLLEHVRPPGVFGKLADRLNPWTSTHFCNEHINRQTDQMLTQAGIQPLQIESAFFKIIKLITARPVQ